MIVNKGFTELKTTDDIKLPENFKEMKDSSTVIDKIEAVVESGNLSELYSLCGEIL